jgi:hypothetical protein
MDEQAKVSRRSLLRGALLLASGTLAAGVIQVKPAFAQKTSKEAAKYQESPKDGQKCADCTFFQAPQSCTVVDGAISPNGWCMIFSKKA